jgi:hypothetical protein
MVAKEDLQGRTLRKDLDMEAAGVGLYTAVGANFRRMSRRD